MTPRQAEVACLYDARRACPAALPLPAPPPLLLLPCAPAEPLRARPPCPAAGLPGGVAAAGARQRAGNHGGGHHPGRPAVGQLPHRCPPEGGEGAWERGETDVHAHCCRQGCAMCVDLRVGAERSGARMCRAADESEQVAAATPPSVPPSPRRSCSLHRAVGHLPHCQPRAGGRVPAAGAGSLGAV